MPSKSNDRLFHFGFNRLAQLNEQLVRGREDIFFGYELAITAGTPLPDEVVKYYVDGIASDPESLPGTFEFRIAHGKIVGIEVVGDPERLGRMQLEVVS